MSQNQSNNDNTPNDNNDINDNNDNTPKKKGRRKKQSNKYNRPKKTGRSENQSNNDNTPKKTESSENQSNNDDTPKKTGRDKYFEMKIRMAYKKKELVNINMDTKDPPNCVKILRSHRFVNQQILEDILFELTVHDSGRSVHIKKFASQLQQERRTGTLYWMVMLETESVTTGRRISLEVTKQLEENMDKSSNDDYGPLTTVISTTTYKELKTDLICSLPNSEWSPGYFSQDTIKLRKLLKKEDVQRSIKDAPEKYNILISHLLKDLETKKISTLNQKIR